MKLTDKLHKVMQMHPELRVGQIILIAARRAGWRNNDIFYCPDEDIERGLDIILGEFQKNKIKFL